MASVATGRAPDWLCLDTESTTTPKIDSKGPSCWNPRSVESPVPLLRAYGTECPRAASLTPAVGACGVRGGCVSNAFEDVQIVQVENEEGGSVVRKRRRLQRASDISEEAAEGAVTRVVVDLDREGEGEGAGLARRRHSDVVDLDQEGNGGAGVGSSDLVDLDVEVGVSTNDDPHTSVNEGFWTGTHGQRQSRDADAVVACREEEADGEAEWWGDLRHDGDEDLEEFMPKRQGNGTVIKDMFGEVIAARTGDGLKVEVGDYVLLAAPPEEARFEYYVALVLDLWTDGEDGGDVSFDARWFYRPEETPLGRLPHHGKQEVFASDHIDSNPLGCIARLCRVIDWRDYVFRFPDHLRSPNGLDPTLFYCRQHYNHNTHRLRQIEHLEDREEYVPRPTVPHPRSSLPPALAGAITTTPRRIVTRQSTATGDRSHDRSRWSSGTNGPGCSSSHQQDWEALPVDTEFVSRSLAVVTDRSSPDAAVDLSADVDLIELRLEMHAAFARMQDWFGIRYWTPAGELQDPADVFVDLMCGEPAVRAEYPFPWVFDDPSSGSVDWRGNDFRRWGARQMLSDNVLSAPLIVLRSVLKDVGLLGDGCKLRVFDSFFYQYVRGISRGSRSNLPAPMQVPWEEPGYTVLFPIHQPGHWLLGMATTVEGGVHIQVVNSLRSTDFASVRRAMFRYLRRYFHGKGMGGAASVPPSIAGASGSSTAACITETPEPNLTYEVIASSHEWGVQHDNYACGFFVVNFLLKALLDWLDQHQCLLTEEHRLFIDLQRRCVTGPWRSGHLHHVVCTTDEDIRAWGFHLLHWLFSWYREVGKARHVLVAEARKSLDAQHAPFSPGDAADSACL